MKELTQSQKAAAFDALVQWLKSEAEIENEIADREASFFHQGMADAYEYAVEEAQKIASQIAQPEQAENMPPAGLDLSQHVGKTAVLWDGHKGEIIASENKEYPFIIDSCDYTRNGHFYSGKNARPCIYNLKTILP